MGKLYVVATPIGNLEDITLRALRILRSVHMIAAEDTRTTRKLLSHYEIQTPLTSYFEHNKLTKLDYLLSMIRNNDVALVSEAGMPGISDPGFELIRAVIDAGLPVVPVPGPSAITTALAISGLPTDEFVYIGFLPRKRSERRRRLREIADEERTIVAFETPHRLLESLQDMLLTLGNRPIAIARELTKVHEEVVRGTIEEANSHFTAHQPRGEFCLVIGAGAVEEKSIDREQIKKRLTSLVGEGLSAKDAVAKTATALSISKKEVYRLWLEIQKGR